VQAGQGDKGCRPLTKPRARHMRNPDADGWMTAGVQTFEESPGSMKRRCRVTPGRGNPRDSATENKPPCTHGKGETVG